MSTTENGEGPNIAEMARHSATLVDKILKGANPADVPIEQPVINLETAKHFILTSHHRSSSGPTR
jgi:putative tryptophan/tyrosine transport system substrate-binding protein